MAKRRVLIYTLHEGEQYAAQQALAVETATEGMVIGTADEAVVAQLETQGLLVEELPAPTAKPDDPVWSGVSHDLMKAMPEVALPAPAAFQAGDYVIRLNGPLMPDWADAIEALSVTLRERISTGYLAKLYAEAQLDALVAMPFVASVTPHSPAPPSPVRGPEGNVAPSMFDVMLAHGVDPKAVAEKIEKLGANVIGVGRRKIRAAMTPSVTTDVDGLGEVESVAPYFVPRLHNDRARALVTQGHTLQFGSTALDGKGQVVAVADSGLDRDHPDFPAERLEHVFALGRKNDSSDPHGHGTHVAGTILGSGKASNGKYRGVAPEAQLVFQSIMDSRGKLGGLPTDLEDLFEAAYKKKARIHNNSWGTDLGSSYTFDSLEVDDYVYRKRPDMLIVISAGNAGLAKKNRHAKKGFVDWASIGTPATAKNALVVGASRSDRTSGGYAKHSHKVAWPDDFPEDPIASNDVSGDPEEMAGFSSRGPCDDWRIKPDLVAPGTDILSCKADGSPRHHFWGILRKHKKAGRDYPYAYMGGTSMAAPVVSGCAALVRQYLVDVHGVAKPSAALLKAILINGTRQATGVTSTADHGKLPNYHQGFGRIDLEGSLPDGAGRKLELIDTWTKPSKAFQKRDRGKHRYTVKLASDGELRLCLAYTDPPGRAVQNDLTLIVEGPDGKHIGNENAPRQLKPYDPSNNVEVVRLPKAAKGLYFITVVPRSVMIGPQHYALVATGPLDGALT